MPLVTIILPTRDRPDVLPRAVASVLAQTERNFELLIIDNGRTPVDPRTLPDARDPRIRILTSRAVPNAAAARNVGLSAATSEWVAFLDDDDAFRPVKLAAQLAHARTTGAPLVGCAAEIHLRGRSRRRFAGVTSIDGDALLGAPVSTPMLLHRRGGVRFDETLFAGEDHVYLLSLCAEFGTSRLLLAPGVLLDVFQDDAARVRTNIRATESWRAARRAWWRFGRQFSPPARRVYAVRSLLARAKLDGDMRQCLRLGRMLLRAGGPSEWRTVGNAVMVAAGGGRGRFVT